VREAGVEAPQDVEHQDTIGHRVAEVTKGIGLGLHLPTVLANGKVPLLEVTEGGVELDGPGLGVPKKLALKR
jgi:hypothetical protein